MRGGMMFGWETGGWEEGGRGASFTEAWPGGGGWGRGRGGEEPQTEGMNWDDRQVVWGLGGSGLGWKADWRRRGGAGRHRGRKRG